MAFLFTRVRATGTEVYVDPDGDIRKVVPAVLLEATDLCGAPEEVATAMKDIVRIFNIRTAEDPKPMLEQLPEFFKAMAQFPEYQGKYMMTVITELLLVYGLFIRRDPDEAQALRKAVAAVRASKSNEQLAEVVEENAAIIDMDSGERIEHIKELACQYMHNPIHPTWEAMSEQCDLIIEHVNEIKHKAAVALAYPNYGQTLSVEVDE